MNRWHIHLKEYCSPFKKERKGAIYDNIMVSEISPTEEDKYHIVSLIPEIKESQTRRSESVSLSVMSNSL